MHEWGEMLHMTCFMWCVNMTWHVYGLGVLATCDQRVTGTDKESV